MEMLILTLLFPAFWWLMVETDWMRVRLPVGIIPKPLELERISWSTCLMRYNNGKYPLSCGVVEPLCGWDWLQNNIHPIPQVNVDFTSGGVRYHWHIKDCNILKDAITATHARPKTGNGQLHFRRNKYGGLVAPLPPKAK